MSSTPWRPAEVLREGSGIKVEATAGNGLAISTNIKDGNLPGKGPPRPTYHQQVQSNEFLLRASDRDQFFLYTGAKATPQFQ